MIAQLIKVGFKTNQANYSWPELVSAWQEGDQLSEFDSAWLWDHFLNVPRPAASGASDVQETGSFEALSVASALGALTERLEFGVLVLGNTYRHPALVAKMAATIDHISNRRFVLGLGAGWLESEHKMYGWALPPIGERMSSLEAAVRVAKGMWGNPEGFSIAAGPYRLEDAVCMPRPLTPGGPRLWIGTHGKQRGLRIVAEYAEGWTTTSDGWSPTSAGSFPNFLEERDALLRHCENLHRDPATIEISIRIFTDANRQLLSPADLRAEASEYLVAGATHVVFVVARNDSASPSDSIRRLAREVAAPLHEQFG